MGANGSGGGIAVHEDADPGLAPPQALRLLPLREQDLEPGTAALGRL
jgi:hypothetical protein